MIQIRRHVIIPDFMSVRVMAPATAGITHLLRATFNAANQGYSNAQVLDTVAEGVSAGQLTVVEVDGTLAIVSNKCAFTAQATPVYGDLGFYSQAITRALGTTFLATVVRDTAGQDAPILGWQDAASLATASTEIAFYFRNAGRIDAWTGALIAGIGAFSTATDYQVAIVLGGYDVNGTPWRSGQAAASYLYGAALYIKGGAYTTWTLLWRRSTDNTATLYAACQGYSDSGTIDDFRVPDRDLSAVLQPTCLSLFASAGELDAYAPELGSAWTEDIGDWDTAGGTLTATALGIATFTGLANCVYDAKVTTPGAGTTAGGLVLRGADYTGASEDYWYVKITPGTAGTDWELIEYAAGAATQRASGDADWTAATAYNIRAICYGTTIDCFRAGGGKITYGSAASGQAATGFGLRDEGNGNMTFDNVALFARTSAVYDSTLDAV